MALSIAFSFFLSLEGIEALIIAAISAENWKKEKQQNSLSVELGLIQLPLVPDGGYPLISLCFMVENSKTST